MKSIIFILLIIITGCKDDTNLVTPVGNAAKDLEADWSPDGKSVAYVTHDVSMGGTGIYLIDTNGQNKRVFLLSGGVATPDWSPDGNWIVYTNGGLIYKKNVFSDSTLLLTPDGRNFNPTWSESGEYIAYERVYSDPEPISYSGIWIMNNDGSNKKKLINGISPSWNGNNEIFYFGLYFDLYKVNVSDTNQKVNVLALSQVNINYSDYKFLDFSLQNNMCVFNCSSTQGGGFQMFTVNSNGTDLRHITTSSQGFSPSWSNNGQQIVYTNTHLGNGRLWLMDKDGNNKRQLTFY